MAGLRYVGPVCEIFGLTLGESGYLAPMPRDILGSRRRAEGGVEWKARREAQAAGRCQAVLCPKRLHRWTDRRSPPTQAGLHLSGAAPMCCAPWGRQGSRWGIIPPGAEGQAPTSQRPGVEATSSISLSRLTSALQIARLSKLAAPLFQTKLDS